MNNINDQSENLTPAVFYILLALSRQDLHGYGIMKQVVEDSQNKIKMGPGTLYGSIQRMLKDKLVEEADGHAKDEERRKYYRITKLGTKAIGGELERYQSAIKVAKKLELMPSIKV
ncbi:MAG: helix-turn-helix transcriptional regulator [Candidatus Doudnabacteria bacterium]|nr:helix-turn-helix transcriptional regulator [Candidatus Doudnabacteria bacterium]